MISLEIRGILFLDDSRSPWPSSFHPSSLRKTCDCFGDSSLTSLLCQSSVATEQHHYKLSSLIRVQSISVSVAQESSPGLPRYLLRLQPNVKEAALLSEALLGKDLLLTSCDCWQLLVDSRAECLSFLLTVSWGRPSHDSYYRQLTTWYPASSKLAGTGSYSNMDITILCDITTWILSFPPCSVGYKPISGSPTPTPTQGEGITQSWIMRNRDPGSHSIVSHL